MNDNEIEKIVTSNKDVCYVLKNSKITINKTDKTYINNKLIHREDGPAIERANGDKCWYKNGVLHRENGPAIESPNGDKQYYIEGKRHREDGPAMNENGTCFWFKKGLLHRENGPAIDSIKIKEWYIDGLLHREDGPAIEKFSGNNEYWINGNKLDKEIFELEKELRKEEYFNNKNKGKKIKV